MADLTPAIAIMAITRIPDPINWPINTNGQRNTENGANAFHNESAKSHE